MTTSTLASPAAPAMPAPGSGAFRVAFRDLVAALRVAGIGAGRQRRVPPQVLIYCADGAVRITGFAADIAVTVQLQLAERGVVDPDQIHLMGFRQWEQRGRRVLRGQKAILGSARAPSSASPSGCSTTSIRLLKTASVTRRADLPARLPQLMGTLGGC